MKVGLIGAGRAGGALALALRAAGYRIAGVADRDPGRARRLAERLGSSVCTGGEAASRAELVFLAVPDEAIPEAAAELAAELPRRGGRVFVHLSGAHPAAIMRPLAPCGALGSLHPLLSLAGTADDAERLRGSYFAFEGEEEAETAARRVVADLNGRFLVVKPGDKPLYHAAAVIIANYLVSLVDVALGLFERLGVSREEARAALHPLLAGTTANLGAADPGDALTGPISRGDLATIRAHLLALGQGGDPGALEVYRTMGRVTVALAERAGRLSREQAAEIRTLLGRICLRILIE